MITQRHALGQSVWQRHRRNIILLFVLFLLVYVSMQFYAHYQTKRALKASLFYDKMMMLSQKPDKTDAIREGTVIIEQYAKTPYAPMAALLMANFAFEKNKIEEAKDYLKMAVHSNSSVAPIARSRLARLLIEQRDLKGALLLLTEKKIPDGFVPIFEEIKGDIYGMQNEPEKARAAYQAAVAAATPGVPLTRLQLKLNQ